MEIYHAWLTRDYENIWWYEEIPYAVDWHFVVQPLFGAIFCWRMLYLIIRSLGGLGGVESLWTVVYAMEVKVKLHGDKAWRWAFLRKVIIRAYQVSKYQVILQIDHQQNRYCHHLETDPGFRSKLLNFAPSIIKDFNDYLA